MANRSDKSPTKTAARRLDPALLARAQKLSSATVYEAAGGTGALPSTIKPIHPDFRVCGPAFTVHLPPGDNLALHHAIYAADEGDVLLAYCAGAREHGYWGEVMSTAARARGLKGLVIDGGVRDCTQLAALSFPVFSSGLCIRGTTKNIRSHSWLQAPILVGDVVINTGDLLIGDCDGVVVVSADNISTVIEAAERRDAVELTSCERLQRGERTIEIFGLPERADSS